VSYVKNVPERRVFSGQLLIAAAEHLQRALVRESLWVICEFRRHEAVLNVDRYGDAVPAPASAGASCISCEITCAPTELARASLAREPGRPAVESLSPRT
jgi:hypothetical protein